MPRVESVLGWVSIGAESTAQAALCQPRLLYLALDASFLSFLLARIWDACRTALFTSSSEHKHSIRSDGKHARFCETKSMRSAMSAAEPMSTAGHHYNAAAALRQVEHGLMKGSNIRHSSRD